MLFLVLAITASLFIGIVFKIAGVRDVDRVQLLTSNYLVASLMGGVLIGLRGREAWEPMLDGSFLAFSVGAGVVLIAGFFIFALATQRAGMSISIAVMRIGVAIPFVVSWLVWSEEPSVSQWVGLVLVGAALFLITRPRKPEPGSVDLTSLAAAAGVLFLLFLGGGAGDLTFKAFDVWFGGVVSEDAFIAVAFGVSFLVGLGVLMGRQGETIQPPAVRWGILLGVANYASVLFILGAVARLPATIVFPTYSVSVVVGGALLGVLIWREEMSAVNLAGVALAAVAVTFLNA